MRRIVGFVLLGLGVFAVAFGLLARVYAYPHLAKVPLDTESVAVTEGDGITALVVTTVDGVPTPEIRDDLSLRSTTYVTGDLTQPEVKADGDVAVYVEAIKTEDESSGILISASVRSLCFDRFTGEAVAPCEGQYIEVQQGKRESADRNTVQQPGLSFKFPFGTEPRDYEVYDMSLRQAVAARFDGEETVQGLDTYRYVVTVPNTKTGEVEVPGSLVGEPDEPSVEAETFYQATRTLWVEPVTGAIVVAQQETKQELVAPGEEPGEGTVVFEGTLALNDQTVNDLVNTAKEGRGQIRLLTVWPIVMCVVGGLLVVVALFLLFAPFGRGGGSSTVRRAAATAVRTGR